MFFDFTNETVHQNESFYSFDFSKVNAGREIAIGIVLYCGASRDIRQNMVVMKTDKAVSVHNKAAAMGEFDFDAWVAVASNYWNDGSVLVRIVEACEIIDCSSISFWEDLERLHAKSEPAQVLEDAVALRVVVRAVIPGRKLDFLGVYGAARFARGGECGMVQSRFQVVEAIAEYECEQTSRKLYHKSDLQEMIAGLRIILNDHSVGVFLNKPFDKVFQVGEMVLRPM